MVQNLRFYCFYINLLSITHNKRCCKLSNDDQKHLFRNLVSRTYSVKNFHVNVEADSISHNFVLYCLFVAPLDEKERKQKRN